MNTVEQSWIDHIKCMCRTGMILEIKDGRRASLVGCGMSRYVPYSAAIKVLDEFGKTRYEGKKVITKTETFAVGETVGTYEEKTMLTLESKINNG